MTEAGEMQVLVVEDCPAQLRLLEESLRDGALTCRLTVAGRLAEALERLAEGGFDLVILDLGLPDSFGLPTLDAVLAGAGGAPIIVLTNSDDGDVATQAMTRGAQDYIVKGELEARTLTRAIRYTVLRRRAEAAERERAAFEEAVSAMEQVLGVVAHELRTPLAAMRATAEYLLGEEESGEASAETAPFLRMIRDESVRMADTVSNLLEAARLDSGRANWNWTLVKLGETCEAVREVFGRLIDPGRVALEIRVAPKDLVMSGDSDALRRLLTNLLSNAAKHTSAGRIAAHVSAEEDADARWVRIEVADTGEGISPQIVSRLGQPFALNRGVIGASCISGAGLGLAICRGIIAAHGGTLSVVSDPGRGTTVTARIRADLPRPEGQGDAPGMMCREAA